MTRCSIPPRQIIMDACVLIDFLEADRTMLTLVVKHIGSLHVTSSVVAEVKGIDSEDELIDLGLLIVEPETEDAHNARQNGPLSFEDWLCLLTAKRHDFTCATNDKILQRVC